MTLCASLAACVAVILCDDRRSLVALERMGSQLVAPTVAVGATPGLEQVILRMKPNEEAWTVQATNPCVGS